jgi:hypothetical protein
MHWSERSGTPKISMLGVWSPILEKARAERHLAAILAADVAGYGRLMGADDLLN